MEDAALHDFFESGFCETFWPANKDIDHASVKAEKAIRLLGATGGHILDWRGGWGAHALHFAKQGFRVTLLDFCERYINMAQACFDDAGFPFAPILADCRETPSDIQADFAVCLGYSVGFLPEEEEVRAFASLRAALKPKARFLVEHMNFFFLASVFPSSQEDATDAAGAIRRTSHSFDFVTHRNHSKFEIVEPDGKLTQREFMQTLYTPHDLARLLTQAGFAVESLYGDFNGGEIGFASRQIIAIART